MYFVWENAMYYRHVLFSGIMFFLLLSIAAKAQVIDTIWARTYERGYDYWDTLGSAQVTSDGGFILVGSTEEDGTSKSDIRLIKTDSDGIMEWGKIIGDTCWEGGYHVLETWDGGYFISAHSDAFGSGEWDQRIWVLKTDASGDTLWSYPFTNINQKGYPRCAVETVDSGFAVTGHIYVPGSSIEGFILKLDRDGNYEWHRHYGGLGMQYAESIVQLPDSGFIISGFQPGTISEVWAARADKDGNYVWDSVYSVTPSHDASYGSCLVDDGVVIVGTCSGEAWLHKIDFDGIPVWSKSIAHTPLNERGYSICTASAGGFMVGGWTGVAGHGRDYCFTRVDDIGDTMWTYVVGYDSSSSSYDHGRWVMETPDGGFAIAGMVPVNTGSRFGLAKIGDVYLDAGEEPIGALPSEFELVANYPNPFNPQTTIEFALPSRSEVKLIVYDILGREVAVLLDETRPAGRHRVVWDGRDSGGRQQASGMYFCMLKAGEYRTSQKMLLLK